VLGGYDENRMDYLLDILPIPTFAMWSRGRHQNPLSVQVVSMFLTWELPNDEFTNLQVIDNDVKSFWASIDSTLPYLFLPAEVCDRLQNVFGLQFDNETGLYFLNDTQREENFDRHFTFTISVTDGVAHGNSTLLFNIRDFDMQTTRPLGKFQNGTNIFPIRRAHSGVPVLGRAFLQRAYIVADFQRQNFTVVPAIYSTEEKIIPILDPSETGSPNETGSTDPSVIHHEPHHGLNEADVAGIAVGVAVGVILILLGIFYASRRRRRRRANAVKPVAVLPGDVLPPYSRAEVPPYSETAEGVELSDRVP
jgi:hypothetical protein